MPIPLINSIASWLLKKRMHQIELFIKYPNEVQNDILLNLINSAKDTFIGKKYNFNSIKNYQNFSERVPVFSYEEFSDKIELARKGENNIFWSSKIKWFANLVVQQMQRVNLFPLAMNRWKIVIMLRAKICYVCI